ncbi:MAG: hypothetical protein QOJ89_531 [bacterium]
MLTLALAAPAPAPAAAPAAAVLDPLLGDQWALSDPALGAREAWTQSQGEGVVVAILDSGVQLDHPDLAANLWTNPGEIAGNGVDDDRNGFVDDVHGANLFDHSGNAADDEGHGTHVAGIVAAAAGNGTGGSGLAPKARIMAVKVMDAASVSDSSLVAHGIRYAVDEGARIVNISLNGDETTPELDDAIAYAGARGATIVASAGNNARDADQAPSFPASSPDPSVLSVTAANRDGSLLAFANRGLHSIDLAAPGERILSTARGSGYELRSGTSMAAPYVCGALALLTAARPDLGAARLRDVLRATASRPPGLLGLLADGEVDVAAAMHAILPGALWRAAPPSDPEAPAPRLRLRGEKTLRAGRTATVRWSPASGVARWTIELDGRRVATRRANDPRVLHKRMRTPGRHRWRVLGRDAAGARIATATRSFRVLRAR